MSNTAATNLKSSYLGLGKTLFNSSAAVITSDVLNHNEVILTERITQKKASGAWPENAIKMLEDSFGHDFNSIAENRDVITPRQFEDNINKSIPFFPYLERKNLSVYSTHFNKEIKTLSHHHCHAYAALMYSPFESSIIVVMDGAGSKSGDFPEMFSDVNEDFHEECSVFIQEGPNLKPIEKFWQRFLPSKIQGHDFSDGTGMLYEKAAEFIFHNKRAAGKVMGLSGFGKPTSITCASDYLEDLPWENSFQSGSKKDWEESKFMHTFMDIAASVQLSYENRILDILTDIRKKYPHIENLILTGGTALNCTSNYKLIEKKFFSNIYVPPFPSDECISFGAAAYLFLKDNSKSWNKKELSSQHGFLGSKKSIPTESNVLETFKDYEITKPENLIQYTSQLLCENKIIGWFQGRSEVGPRALGNRSILANPLRKNLKKFLNENIKFREDFRPYGCSIPQEFASEYFKVESNFHNPYMSFACKVNQKYIEELKEVSHIDSTSRMQTVTSEFNPKFYQLLKAFGDTTGIYCLLNTSLNIMGKPIVETVKDARDFLESTNVDGIVIGDFYIKSKN